MQLDLGEVRARAEEAVRFFWESRNDAAARNAAGDRADQGRRGEATGGKALDQFVSLMEGLVELSGFDGARVSIRRGQIALPGYYRPSKQWDLVVTHDGDVVAAVEFKSHMGLTNLGKNYNNRNEEAVGSAVDFWTAWESTEAADRPFLGWFLLVEESYESTRPLVSRVSYGQVDSEFRGASFLQRYDILCQRLVGNGLYSAAGVMGISAEDATSGEYSDVSDATSFVSFADEFFAFMVDRARARRRVRTSLF